RKDGLFALLQKECRMRRLGILSVLRRVTVGGNSALFPHIRQIPQRIQLHQFTHFHTFSLPEIFSEAPQ
ncbi:hypothetical protein K6716_03335, partial [Escherichia marmotae]|uniref:hypothetical protein n=1 Tax=Escherichia ruysiae TaxID=2608867 RepID=UPI001C9B183C|nr:hypothetical protein [Escherichia ruysiae]MBY7618732.1 hypothetical protein [Escherichia marmotae]